MSLPELILGMRTSWIRRVSNSMARGTDVRESFRGQLEKFFDLLVQAVTTGTPGWIDPILMEWATSPTQSDLLAGEERMAEVLNRILMTTFEIAREDLTEQEALELLGAILPIFTYGVEKATSYELEKRVNYISNELVEMQTKLERLDRSKSNFISVAAHELKTPLTLIEGYTSMIRDSVEGVLMDPERVNSLIDGVHNGIHRLRTIVDDMIDVSLIDNNLLALNFQPVWLDQILKLIHGELSNTIVARKQEYVLNEFQGLERMFFADPERIYQAFLNILSNAIKFTPDGGRISVSGRTLPGFIEVIVTDSGIGISPEDQETIFEKFGQLGNILLHSSGKTKFKGGGPGLGLPIARGIIDAHGGTIWVESEGHDEACCPGSTFHVMLPLRDEPSDPMIAKLFGTTTSPGN